ncbi:MAG: hypothetical protein AAFQ79_03385 [Pseudomonadota bacterium]
MIRPALLSLIALAACASPQERCISEATEDLRVVNTLISESQANLDRGYAIETVNEPRVGFTFCTGRNSNIVLCTASENSVRDRPVAIDLAAEQQKLNGLVSKKRELETRTRRDLAQCDAVS